MSPIYRVETDRFVLRCPNPSDAPAMVAAIRDSIDHLQRRMPWADDEPRSVEEHAEKFRLQRGKFDLGQDYAYLMLAPDESSVWGAMGLHTRRGPHIREIGYWIAAKMEKQGLTTEGVCALTRVALAIDKVARVEIHCDQDNVASARVAEKAGFVNEGILKHEFPFRGGFRDTMMWAMTPSMFEASPAARVAVRAYDVLGRLVG